MRATIRFSLDGDAGGLTTHLSSVLSQRGFGKLGVGVFEHSNIEDRQLALTMTEFWSVASTAAPGVVIDHLWMYSTRHVAKQPS